MTKLLPGKSIVRETAMFERTSAIVVELRERGLTVRLKGKPTAGVFWIPYDAILDLGRKLSARERRKS